MKNIILNSTKKYFLKFKETNDPKIFCKEKNKKLPKQRIFKDSSENEEWNNFKKQISSNITIFQLVICTNQEKQRIFFRKNFLDHKEDQMRI